MAGLRELKKHLKSIKTTGQLAGAMKTVSTAKYSRVNASLAGYREYAAACGEMLSHCGKELSSPINPSAPECIVVMSGNRGLCGGYNLELLSYFKEKYSASGASARIVAVGRKAGEYCAEKGIPIEKKLVFGDVPDYSDSAGLAEYLLGMFVSGEVSGVTFIYQSFRNMLSQTPASVRVLPISDPEKASDDMTLYIPDEASVSKRLTGFCFAASIHSLVLETAAGSQAATLIAMRSAYDNAHDSAQKLETAINRRRQASVTAGVIETASDNAQ